MPDTKLGNNTWVPDIRANKVSEFSEGEDTYKAVDAHPILNRILDAKAFFRTHAGAVWYNKKSEKTVVDKFNEVDKTLEPLTTSWRPHRLLLRGKNLGNALTDAQKKAIHDGTFDDLYLGDYWVINNRTWRIVDFDYWWNSGDTTCIVHHILVMPDSALYNYAMNPSNTTEKGYIGSDMYINGLTQAKNMVTADFGSNVLSHRELFTNTTTSGYPSNGAWVNSTVDLPNEIMIYGSYIFTPGANGSIVPYRYTIDKQQLALMMALPYYTNPGRYSYWLRDVVTAAHFAVVGLDGLAACNAASDVRGVRPVVGITA